MARYMIEWKYKANDPESQMPDGHFEDLVVQRYYAAGPADGYYECHDNGMYGPDEDGVEVYCVAVYFEAHTAAIARQVLEDVRLHYVSRLDDITRITLRSDADDAAESALYIDRAQNSYPEIVEFLRTVADTGTVEWRATSFCADVDFKVGPWSCTLGWPGALDDGDPDGCLPMPALETSQPASGESLTWSLHFFPDDSELSDEPTPALTVQVFAMDEESIGSFLRNAHAQLIRAGILK